MKKIIRMLTASVIFGLAASPFMPASANATLPQGASAIETTCEETSGWYVNGDETSRKPEVTATGFKFSGNDLMHRQVDLPLAQLLPGTYEATPAPDQPSFFSVEVRNSAGAYGTLRWQPGENKWLIVIGAGNGATDGTFYGADPVALLEGKITKWGAFDAAPIKVISYGVGYTNSPSGEVTTVVKSVTFQGTKRSLVCQPPAPSASASSASPSPSSSTSRAPVAGPTLPVTGSKPYFIAAAGAITVFLGVALVVAFRKRGQ